MSDAQWNLSVRLSGQGSDLARTLRTTARDARAASRDVNALRRDIARLRSDSRNNIRIRLGVDAGHLRRDVRSALSSAGSGQRIGVRLGVDARHLRSDVQAALTSAGAGQGIRIRLNVDGSGIAALRAEIGPTAHSLNVLQRAAREAKNELEELETRALTTAAAVRTLNTAATRGRTRLDGLSGSTRTFRSDLDDLDGSLTRVGANLNGLRGRIGGLGGGSNSGSGSGARGWLQGLLLLAPAAIPLVAGLSTALAPLPGQFAAVGVGAGAFGAALAGQIGRLSEVVDAEKKYQDAVREHGKASAEAIQAQVAYQKRLAELPPQAQQAAIALSGLKTTFKDWSDDMASFTMTPLTNGITVLDTLIPRLSPHVESFSTQLDRLVSVAGGAVQTPGFDAMADRFADFSDRQLDEMTDQVMHFLRVLSEGGAFQSGPIAEFMAYARENGPAAREALSAISDAVVTLLRGAAEAGPSILTLVTAVARLVAALPPELVGIILQVATALKLLQLTGAGMAALAAGLGRVRTQIAALAATSAAAGGGLAGLRAAFMSLGVAARAAIAVAGIGALLLIVTNLANLGKKAPPDVDRLTTSLGKLGQTGKVTGEAARAFGKDFSGLADSLRTLSRPSNLDKTQQFLTKLVGMDSTPFKEAKEDLDAVDKSLASLVQGGKADLAAAAFDRVAEAMRKGGMSGKELRAQMDSYKSALADAAFEQELAAQSMGLFGQAAQDTQAKLEAQKKSADGLRQSIIALNEVNRAAGSAMSAFEQSLDDATEATKEHAGALKMRDGDLDLGSEKAREAEKILSELAANTDAAATSAREQGRSWEYVQGIMTRGQEAFVQAAMKMGLTKQQAQGLAKAYLDIPSKKSTTLEMRTEDAVAGLNSVIAAIKRTPNAKSVTVKALTQDAVSLLRELGFKVTRLPDGRFKVTAETGTAKANLAAVQRARDALKNKTIDLAARDRASGAVRAIQAAIAGLRDRTVTITTVRQTIATYSTSTRPVTGQGGVSKYADGALVDYYADGGIQRGGVRHFAGGAEQHVAQFARAGTWRVWGEPETGGEAYIPLAMSKRGRSRNIAEETVRRLGGDPATIQWNADGSVTDWRYDPQTGSLYSPSDAGSAGRKTKKVKGKEVSYFDLGAVERKLKSAGRATQAWNRDLEIVAERAGGDVAEALAAMGQDGVALTRKMAHGSKKYLAEMSMALRNLAATARASLTDYKVQLTHATVQNEKFAENLAKLAGKGYGDLAGQLAAQNDEAAMELAAAAVRDPKKASAANKAAQRANNALTSEQVSELVQIIAAISTKSTGIHDVATKTGLGEDEIITVANKAKSQISTSLGSRATRFLADLGKANKHQAYADGGLRAGIYATRAGIIRFAEPETHGEAYVPLSPSKRRTAMPVLADVASRFGVGLTDAQATRPVVIVRGEGDTNVNVTAVRTGATASDIGAQVGRSVRRARRGGVSARAA